MILMPMQFDDSTIAVELVNNTKMHVRLHKAKQPTVARSRCINDVVHMPRTPRHVMISARMLDSWVDSWFDVCLVVYQ